MNKEKSKLEAERRKDEALIKIEKAQGLLLDACEEISRLVHIGNSWEEVGDLYEKVKSAWHTLDMWIGVDMDSDWKRDSDKGNT